MKIKLWFPVGTLKSFDILFFRNLLHVPSNMFRVKTPLPLLHNQRKLQHVSRILQLTEETCSTKKGLFGKHHQDFLDFCGILADICYKN